MGARVRRLAVRHFTLQRYVGRRAGAIARTGRTRLLLPVLKMPILPGIKRMRGDYGECSRSDFHSRL